MNVWTQERRIGRTWILLAGLTLGGMAAVRFGVSGLLANAAMLAIAVIKARCLLWNFLDIRSASSGWRVVFLTWLALIAATAWTTSMIAVLLGP
jgi:hypothetical protein